jgi:hypothetical protein
MLKLLANAHNQAMMKRTLLAGLSRSICPTCGMSRTFVEQVHRVVERAKRADGLLDIRRDEANGKASIGTTPIKPRTLA